jgi:hypothetical protein
MGCATHSPPPPPLPLPSCRSTTMNRLIVGMHACVVAYGTAVQLQPKADAAAGATGARPRQLR